jgi:hypothetical protein
MIAKASNSAATDGRFVIFAIRMIAIVPNLAGSAARAAAA